MEKVHIYSNDRRKNRRWKTKENKKYPYRRIKIHNGKEKNKETD